MDYQSSYHTAEIKNVPSHTRRISPALKRCLHDALIRTDKSVLFHAAWLEHGPAKNVRTPATISLLVPIFGELYHSQRLKPEFYDGPDGPAEARALIRTSLRPNAVT